MTFEEAIEHAYIIAEHNEKKAKLYKKEFEPLATRCRECANEHRQLAEWLKDYSRLLEKATPKRYDINIDTAICPVCRTQLERQSMLGENILFHKQYNYCPECGQKIDWAPTTYECDPEKNMDCRKTACQKECHRTTKKEFAKTEEETE